MKPTNQNRSHSLGLAPFIQAFPCQTNIDLKFRQAKSSSYYKIRQFIIIILNIFECFGVRIVSKVLLCDHSYA